MAKIVGHEYQISKIFSSDFDFVIPSYQRPYAWTTEEAGELFDDIKNFMEKQAVAGADDPYFLGSIVLIKTEDVPHAEVIDGQQRLTTITILLAALVDRLTGERAQSLAKYINEPGDLAEERESKPRLTLRDRDQVFFHDYIQTRGRLGELAKRDDNTLPDPQKNIQANAKLFTDNIKNMDEDKAFELGKFVVNHCYLVAVSTPSMYSAYRIFSVLNTRGLDLLPCDILKSEIIGKIEESRCEEYTKKWEDAEESLGRDAFSELFSHIRMIYRKAKQDRTVLEEFRKYVILVEKDPQKLIDDVLCPYADAYLIIGNASYKSAEHPENVNQLLEWLLRIDNTDWVPPAILFMKDNLSDQSLCTSFLKGLECLTASMFIRRIPVGQRIGRFGALIRSIQNGDNLFQADSQLMLSTDEKALTSEVLDGDIYWTNPKVRSYILLRLDSWLAESTASYEHKTITVEHVLPQTVSLGSEWESTWPDHEMRRKWVHKLGNLVLLSRRKNSSAQNYDFATKKEKYFQTRSGVSLLAITTTVLQRDEWTPEVVEEQHREMLNKLKEGWNL